MGMCCLPCGLRQRDKGLYAKVARWFGLSVGPHGRLGKAIGLGKGIGLGSVRLNGVEKRWAKGSGPGDLVG